MNLAASMAVYFGVWVALLSIQPDEKKNHLPTIAAFFIAVATMLILKSIERG